MSIEWTPDKVAQVHTFATEHPDVSAMVWREIKHPGNLLLYVTGSEKLVGYLTRMYQEMKRCERENEHGPTAAETDIYEIDPDYEVAPEMESSNDER